MNDQPVDLRLVQAVELFNQREFFACHDVLEEIWSETLSEDRDFYQGLIHAAVALFHFEEGNLGGARKMHDSAIHYLAPFNESHHGIDLNKFRDEFDRCFQALLGPRSDYPMDVVIHEQAIPQLTWTPRD